MSILSVTNIDVCYRISIMTYNGNGNGKILLLETMLSPVLMQDLKQHHAKDLQMPSLV